ncbi:hypothetical protein MTP03_47050 [Tsukamurella sp. PLM1]|nr:hypothetical protein MTP03_47050 [Tsukamurella sp. PLM1]
MEGTCEGPPEPPLQWPSAMVIVETVGAEARPSSSCPWRGAGELVGLRVYQHSGAVVALEGEFDRVVGLRRNLEMFEFSVGERYGPRWVGSSVIVVQAYRGEDVAPCGVCASGDGFKPGVDRFTGDRGHSDG